MSEYNAAKKAYQYTLTLNPANQEFSQRIPNDARVIKIRARENNAVRYSFTQNKVAGSLEPYHTLKAGAEYTLYDVEAEDLTIYFATAVAGTTVEIEVWTADA